MKTILAPLIIIIFLPLCHSVTFVDNMTGAHTIGGGRWNKQGGQLEWSERKMARKVCQNFGHAHLFWRQIGVFLHFTPKSGAVYQKQFQIGNP